MRHPEWEVRLALRMERELARPFSWSSANCGHLMCVAVAASHDSDHPLLDYLDQFTDEETAKALVVKHGGLSALLAKHLKEVPKLQAQDGDLGVFEVGASAAGCVVINGMAVGRSETGTFWIPVRRLTRTFH